jgi:uncharacterized protein (TIGR02611 family)
MFKIAVRHTKRLVIGVVGVTIVAVGFAFFVLPGPGLLIVIIGLAVLASEFVWAKRLLDQAKGHYDRAKNKVFKKSRADQSPREDS